MANKAYFSCKNYNKSNFFAYRGTQRMKIYK